MSAFETCCTCATPLADTKVPYDVNSEKPLCLDRKLECCGRTICATCQYKNARFQRYCPFCQISTAPNAIPSEGLKLPPSYNAGDSRSLASELPPAYDSPSSRTTSSSNSNRPPADTRDTVHFISSDDTIHSLSLAYHVPENIIRHHNNVYQDSLLQARKFILIPHTHYNGPALSTPPNPEEEERKNRIRRWMVATKCADYNVAVLYLKASDYNLEVAVESFQADEQWEREHPLEGKGKGKRKQTDSRSPRNVGGGSLTGQL